jgi:hypothetical protein
LPVEVVREPAGKIFQKILEQIKTFWFRSKVFRINGKVPLLFKKILEHIKTFCFVSKFLD